MPAKNAFVAVLSFLLVSCASAQKGSLIQANKAIAKEDYQECLGKLSFGETLGDYSDAVNAQITFTKGLCLEGVGRKAEALALYRNLIARYPHSDWAAQGKARLDSDSGRK
jgi:tetratricopeptide (TPR) repeat protein